jgi:hypothetical protein
MFKVDKPGCSLLKVPASSTQFWTNVSDSNKLGVPDLRFILNSSTTVDHLRSSVEKLSDRAALDLTNMLKSYSHIANIAASGNVAQMRKVHAITQIPETIATSPFSEDALHTLLMKCGITFSSDILIDDVPQSSGKEKNIRLRLSISQDTKKIGLGLRWKSNILSSASKQLTYVWGHPFFSGLEIPTSPNLPISEKTLSYSDVSWVRDTFFDLSHKAIISRTIRPISTKRGCVLRTTYALGTGTIKPHTPITLTSNLASMFLGFSAFSKAVVSTCPSLTVESDIFLGFQFNVGASWVPSTLKDQRVFIKGSHSYALYSSGLLTSIGEHVPEGILLGYLVLIPGVSRVK